MNMSTADLESIRRVLDDWRHRLEREDPWPFLTGRTPESLTAREANAFLLGSVLQYQQDADLVWRNAARLRALFNDPDDLWHKIVAMPEPEFVRLFAEHKLHRFKEQTGRRVRRIAVAMVRVYDGDARRIWQGGSDSQVRARLLQLVSGQQIPEMIMNALMETGQLQGTAQIKADIHTKRVLGRLFAAREFSETEANAAAGILYPDNPRLADRGLFEIGRRMCSPTNPGCALCPLKPACRFAAASSA